MSINILNIEPQVYVSKTEPKPELVLPIKEIENKDKKPRGGLWTSRKYYKNNEVTSPWIEWSQGNNLYDDNVHVWELTINNPCKVLEINSKDDIINYCKKYKHNIDGEMYKFNWDYIFDELNCDAIYLTEEGVRNLTGVFVDKKYSMISWDVESMLWSNWKFSNIEKIRTL